MRLRSSWARAFLASSFFFNFFSLFELVPTGIFELQNGGSERSLQLSVAAFRLSGCLFPSVSDSKTHSSQAC